MNVEWLLGSASVIVLSILTTKYLVQRKSDKSIAEYNSVAEAIAKSKETLNTIEKETTQVKTNLTILQTETKDLQELRKNADSHEERLAMTKLALSEINAAINQAHTENELQSLVLKEVMSKLDLYSRLEEFVDYGLYEEPAYLFETSERYAVEIRKIREQQKNIIKQKKAVSVPNNLMLWSKSAGDAPNSFIKKIIEGQSKLLILAFNLECDILINKVTPSNLDRTLERIEKVAANLEKCVADWHCGFSSDYVILKYDECTLQYQFQLRKKEEKEEQTLIKEQMREEQKAIREYEKALSEAEKEEKLYQNLLSKAREELLKASDEERILAKIKISELEEKLAEAEQREKRAKSLAEITRRGYVYVISNIGSFGDDVYKIGMTRRLDPMDRVKELGDASVPFRFDVHAIIYAEDAPALETSLHRKFKNCRVNAVNFRKEFFYVGLNDIKNAVVELTGGEIDFKLTVLAEEYYETLRLRGERSFSKGLQGNSPLNNEDQRGFVLN